MARIVDTCLEELVRPINIEIGRPEVVGGIRVSRNIERDADMAISVLQNEITEARNQSPAHMSLYNIVAERRFDNPSSRAVTTKFLRLFEQALDADDDRTSAQDIAVDTAQAMIAVEAYDIVRKYREIEDECDRKELDEIDDDFAKAERMIREVTRGSGRRDDRDRRDYRYDRDDRDERRRPPRREAYRPNTVRASSRATSSREPRDDSVPRRRMTTATAFQNKPEVVQEEVIEVKETKPKNTKVTAEDWIPTVNQPYRTLVEVGQTEEFTRLEDGHVFAEVTGTPGEKDWMKVTSFGRLPTYEHPEKHSAYIQRVKTELVNSAEKLVHEAAEKDYIYKDISEAASAAEFLCTEDLKTSGPLKGGAAVCYTTLFIRKDTAGEQEARSGIVCSEKAMKANILLKMMYTGNEGFSVKPPKQYVSFLDNALTEVVNRLLSVNLFVPNLRIDSFADDFVELTDSMNKMGLQHHSQRLNDIVVGYFMKGNWGLFEEVGWKLYFDKEEALYSNLGVSIPKYEEFKNNWSVSHKKGFAIFVPLLAGEFGFNLYPGEVKLIDAEQQEWLHRLAREAHLHKLNNFVLRDVYLKSMDGVVFRIDVAEMLDERYLISRV
jgi:hypothetical protein